MLSFQEVYAVTAMINPQAEAADPTLAAELLRRRWQEKPAYFLPLNVKPVPKLHAMWRRLPGGVAPVMHGSDLRGLQT
jgi:hypothetical protein